MTKTIRPLLKEVVNIIILAVSMAGFVPKQATFFRANVMLFSLAFAYYLSSYQALNSTLAITYFIAFEIFYVGFISIVLSENGLRLWFIKALGEEKGYLAFEAILGFLFFHNGVSIGYIASSTPGNLFHSIPQNLLLIIVSIMFISGFVIKILAAKAVTINIYYWKDMFLGKKISDFVVSGPYKYFKNPMYGLGQLQAYAIAIWYGSLYGLMAAFINQALIFTFYYLIETGFINRVYRNGVATAI